MYDLLWCQKVATQKFQDLGCLVCVEYGALAHGQKKAAAEGSSSGDEGQAATHFDKVRTMGNHIDAVLRNYISAERDALNRLNAGTGSNSSSSSSSSKSGGGGENAGALGQMLLPVMADQDAWSKRREEFHLPSESESLGDSDAMRHVALQFIDACKDRGDGRK